MDIKPQNILVGYEELDGEGATTGGLHDGRYPTIKLADFGSATYTGDHRDQKANYETEFLDVGTHGFQPPVCVLLLAKVFVLK